MQKIGRTNAIYPRRSILYEIVSEVETLIEAFIMKAKQM